MCINSSTRRYFPSRVSWEGPLPQIQRAQEKGETVLDQALLIWMAQAVEEVIFNLCALRLLLSALFGNPDQDACLVDKSVTLEIGRNLLCLATCTPSQLQRTETRTSTLFKVCSVSLPYNCQVQRTIYLKKKKNKALLSSKLHL